MGSVYLLTLTNGAFTLAAWAWYSTVWHGLVRFWCVFTLTKKTNWAMQLFSLYMIHFNMLQGEGGEWKSYLSYYDRTHVHARLLEGRSQQKPFDWQRRMTHFKHFEARRRSCHLVFNLQWHCYQQSRARTKDTLEISLPCRAIPSQHSRAKFGMLQLGTIPVYSTKSRRAVPYPAASVNAL